jgi:hypothetical protein
VAALTAEFTHEPYDGHASTDAVRFNSILNAQRWKPFGAVHHRGESFLRVFEYREVIDDALKLVSEEHVKSVIVD